MHPLLVMRVVISVLGSTQVTVAEIQLQILGLAKGRIEGRRGVSEPMGGRRSQAVHLIRLTIF